MLHCFKRTKFVPFPTAKAKRRFTTTPIVKMPNRYTKFFANPKGAGDARPTSLDIVKDEGRVNQLSDKVMVVTGTSSGIGIETVRALAATGAKVYGTVRNMDKGKKALEGILEPGRVELLEMDLNSLQSVRDAAKTFLEKSGGKLNVLIDNAGVMETPEGKTVDGFETQFGTCHLAHFLFFNLVKDAMLKSSTPEFNSRVVSVASMGHKYGPLRAHDLNFTEPKSYDPKLAYGNAKTANIYFANQIERLYGNQGLHAWSLHPGGIMTGLQEFVDPAVKEGWAKTEGVQNYMSSPAQGAATSVLAAVGKEWEGKGGLYLEECDVAKPEAETPGSFVGYKDYAYNPEGEEKLWQESLKMVGLA